MHSGYCQFLYSSTGRIGEKAHHKLHAQAEPKTAKKEQNQAEPNSQHLADSGSKSLKEHDAWP